MQSKTLLIRDSSTIFSKSRCTPIIDNSFAKLSNLKARFNISVKCNISILVRRAKYTIYYQVIKRKAMIEKQTYFYNDYNINTCINYYHLLKLEKDMSIIKNNLHAKFINKVELKLKKKSILPLSVSIKVEA